MDYRKLSSRDKDSEDDKSIGIEGNLVKKGEEDEVRWVLFRSLASEYGCKFLLILALTLLTSSQGILISWSKSTGEYVYSVASANCMVELLKCFISLVALLRIWRREGVTEDNNLSTSWEEIKVYPIPAGLYLVKNLLQYHILTFVDAPSYQILKNLNIVATGVLYRICLKRRLSYTQWVALALLALGCTISQLNSASEHVFRTSLNGWIMAIVMASLSGFAGVYTEAIMKKTPTRNVHVQNFWLYIFGITFTALAIVLTQDFKNILERGFFYGFDLLVVIMIINHALSGLAVSMVMKYADNIVKVYSTSVAMLLTAAISILLFDYKLSTQFMLGSGVVSISVFLHFRAKVTK